MARPAIREIEGARRSLSIGDKMLGLAELKKNIVLTDAAVECPVRGCPEKVMRQREVFRHSDEFKCPRHQIYISPSTFEYESMWDNLLWKSESDRQFLRSIMRAKRESRMARDNSEDAVTWNVFRFLQSSHLLGYVLESICEQEQNVNQIIYWSYSSDHKGTWEWLRVAREQFETVPDRGSEPDLIITTDTAIFFIEAKLNAGNRTTPSTLRVSDKYQSGAGSWFRDAFISDFNTVAVSAEKYELMRFWLLGTWIASNLNLEFYLVNLVRSQAEQNIEKEFGPHIKSTRDRIFKRYTWDQIYEVLLANPSPIERKDEIVRYFKNKTIGYLNGKLRAAFAT